MRCAVHSEVAASAICTRCETWLCAECAQDRGGKNFCAKCAAFLDQRAQGRPPRPTSTAPPAPPVPAAVPAGAGGDMYQGPTSAAPAGGEMYQGPSPSAPAGGDMYQGPTPGAAGGGDVYQGPDAGASAGGDMYQGPDAAASGGDVYQGPPASGVYQGPPAGAASSPMRAQGAGPPAAESGGSLIPGVAFGILAGAASAGIWYGVAISMNKTFGLLAILVGLCVGFATAMGAKRGGPDVAMISVGITILALLIGEYQIIKHIFTAGPQEEIAMIRQDIEQYILESEYEFETREEVEEYLAFLEELAGEPISFGDTFSYLGIIDYFFLGLAAFNAWKIPMGKE